MSDKPEALKLCPAGPNGKHQLDTTMESGPNNCFFCETSLAGKFYETYRWGGEPRASDSALADELEFVTENDGSYRHNKHLFGANVDRHCSGCEIQLRRSNELPEYDICPSCCTMFPALRSNAGKASHE